jgi:hypothetical protein
VARAADDAGVEPEKPPVAVLERSGETPMKSFTRRLALVAVLAILGLGLAVSTASAQRQIRPGPLVRSRPNYGNYYVAPGLTINQLAYNTAVMGRAYSNYPAYMFGYNPYPPTINYVPSYYNPYAGYPGLTSVYSSYYNPYVAAALYSSAYNPYGLYGYSYLYR